jgi:UDP-N-acetylglucosamine 1-carboxyvinyltransferase
MTKKAFRIEGGNPVSGEITCLGAKNFITKAMVASLLGEGETTLTNVPPIGDTTITFDMLKSIGVEISYSDPTTLKINPLNIQSSNIVLPQSGSNRVPILLLSALLQRFSEVKVPILGGCKIGERSVGFHLDAIKQFGGEVIESEEGYIAKRKGKLIGTKVNLPYPSVGATETFLYLSVLAKGTSIISNAAIEPEIFELITMLRSMGAIIFTSSGREIRVEGVEKLKGTTMKILGDRIEAASWASLACASDGEIIVHGIKPEILGNFLAYFRQVGGGFDLIAPNSIKFYRAGTIKPTVIESDVYPGFSTDWQQPFAIILTKADGISVIHETVYEDRFGYLTALKQLGAKVQTTSHCLGGIQCRYKGTNYQHSAIIYGPTELVSNDSVIEIPDLRAGLAYVIAGAIAKGTITLTGIHNVERGYGDIIPRLQALKLKISKVDI